MTSDSEKEGIGFRPTPRFDDFNYNLATTIRILEGERESYASNNNVWTEQANKLDEQWTSIAAAGNGGALLVISKALIDLPVNAHIPHEYLISVQCFLAGLFISILAQAFRKAAIEYNVVSSHYAASVTLKLLSHYQTLQDYINDDLSRKRDDVIDHHTIDRDDELGWKIVGRANSKSQRNTRRNAWCVYISLAFFSAGVAIPLLYRR